MEGNNCLSGQVNKKIKEEAKQRSWQEDQEYKRQWEAQLDKQERERTSRLERLKKVQNQQEKIASSRPEAKQWLDPAIIERYYKEREDARAADEELRAAKVSTVFNVLLGSIHSDKTF